MSHYALKFATGDGQSVQLNSAQLRALLSLALGATRVAMWGTYWALRNRNLIAGTGPHFTDAILTERGKAVVTEYERKRDGSQA